MVNHKRVNRLYREDGLGVRLKRPAGMSGRQPAASAGGNQAEGPRRALRCRPMRDRSPGRHRMAGRRERGKGGGDDAAAGSAGAVAPVFVPRRIGP